MAETISNDPADANSPDVSYQEESVVEQGVPATDESVEQEQSEVADAAPQEENPEPAPAAAKTEKFEKRFTELTRRAEESRRLAEDERQARERLEHEVAQYRSAPQSKPQYENFVDPQSFAEALADWEGNRVRVETEQKIRGEYQKEQQHKNQVEWMAKQDAAKSDYEDYDLVVSSASAIVSNEIQQAILESDYGPHLLYKLADDDALVAKLQRLPTTSALRELGKIEAGIEAARSNKQQKSVKGSSSAPEPISPLRQSRVIKHDVMPSGDVIIDNLDNYRRLRQAGKIR